MKYVQSSPVRAPSTIVKSSPVWFHPHRHCYPPSYSLLLPPTPPLPVCIPSFCLCSSSLASAAIFFHQWWLTVASTFTSGDWLTLPAILIKTISLTFLPLETNCVVAVHLLVASDWLKWWYCWIIDFHLNGSASDLHIYCKNNDSVSWFYCKWPTNIQCLAHFHGQNVNGKRHTIFAAGCQRKLHIVWHCFRIFFCDVFKNVTLLTVLDQSKPTWIEIKM